MDRLAEEDRERDDAGRQARDAKIQQAMEEADRQAEEDRKWIENELQAREEAAALLARQEAGRQEEEQQVPEAEETAPLARQEVDRRAEEDRERDDAGRQARDAKIQQAVEEADRQAEEDRKWIENELQVREATRAREFPEPVTSGRRTDQETRNAAAAKRDAERRKERALRLERSVRSTAPTKLARQQARREALQQRQAARRARLAERSADRTRRATTRATVRAKRLAVRESARNQRRADRLARLAKKEDERARKIAAKALARSERLALRQARRDLRAARRELRRAARQARRAARKARRQARREARRKRREENPPYWTGEPALVVSLPARSGGPSDEKSLEAITGQILVGRHWRTNGLSLRTGIAISKINSKVSEETTTTETVSRTAVIRIIQHPDGTRTEETGTVQVQQTTTREERYYNSLSSVDFPLLLGYRLKGSRYALLLEAGPSLNISSGGDAHIRSGEGFRAVSGNYFLSRRSGIGFQAVLTGEYQLTENTALIGGLRIQSFGGGFENPEVAPSATQVTTVGLQLGYRMRF